MEWKNLCNGKSKHATLIEIKENASLKANIKTFLSKNIWMTILIVLIIILALIVTFHNNLKSLGLSLTLFVVLFISFVFFNSYCIKCKNGEIKIRMNMQEIKMPYQKLKSVYIEERKGKVMFIPIRSYYLVLMYQTIKEEITDISFSTLFLNIKEAKAFLDHFIFENIKTDHYEKCIEYKKKRILIKLSIFLLFCVIITVSILLF